MTTNDIDWSLAPEGAVAIGVRIDTHDLNWLNANGRIWLKNTKEWSAPLYTRKTIATRPQTERKTIEDAVEYLNETSDGEWDSEYYFLCYRNGHWCFSYKNLSGLVCTREQFERCVADKYVKLNQAGDDLGPVLGAPEKQKESEWTHTHENKKCVIKVGPNKTGQVFVEFDDGYWECVYVDELETIKPTITKAESEKVLEFAESIGQLQVADFWLDKYTITD